MGGERVKRLVTQQISGAGPILTSRHRCARDDLQSLSSTRGDLARADAILAPGGSSGEALRTSTRCGRLREGDVTSVQRPTEPCPDNGRRYIIAGVAPDRNPGGAHETFVMPCPADGPHAAECAWRHQEDQELP